MTQVWSLMSAGNFNKINSKTWKDRIFFYGNQYKYRAGVAEYSIKSKALTLVKVCIAGTTHAQINTKFRVPDINPIRHGPC